jgi:hypothetical protein
VVPAGWPIETSEAHARDVETLFVRERGGGDPGARSWKEALLETAAQGESSAKP